jgi:hypothetical protein
MRLTLDSIAEDLGKVTRQILSDELDIGIVGYLGTGTRPIGLYFGDALNCGVVKLPSIMRKNRSASLAKMINKAYPFFPENLLRVLSQQYKRIYHNSERIFPRDFNWNKLKGSKSEILLVDDNALTGSTLEMWKSEIKENTKRNTKTFSITVTGDYRPDYFCYEGWRSFEWRPIGI